MKRVMVLTLFAFLLVSLLATSAGCGGSNGDSGKKDGAVVNGQPDGSGKGGGEEGYSVVGTYQSAEGKYVTLKEDGTFKTDAWASQEGNYVYAEHEGGKWVSLFFSDGSTLRMSVMIAEDEVAAIVDDKTMTQYTKE
ncbi:MAG: hypothetical protein H5T73_03225 [Actinobacteria bacterium]|nr:hypothetical protein [Actinomycetota bacterium]